MHRFVLIGLGVGLASPTRLAGQVPPAGRQCATSEAPKDLPALDQIADSAALVEAARARVPATAAVDITLGLRGSRAGVDSVWLVHADPAGPPADSLTSALLRTVWRPRKSDFAGVRVRNFEAEAQTFVRASTVAREGASWQ